MIDLMVYAEQHRLRVRNLADGAPLLPLRGSGVRHSRGYGGVEEAEHAIIGSAGYVTGKGVPEGKVGVHLVAGSSAGLTLRMAAIEAAGWDRKQRGELEAFGYLDEGKLDIALKAIKVYRIGVGNRNPNTSGLKRFKAAGSA